MLLLRPYIQLFSNLSLQHVETISVASLQVTGSLHKHAFTEEAVLFWKGSTSTTCTTSCQTMQKIYLSVFLRVCTLRFLKTPSYKSPFIYITVDHMGKDSDLQKSQSLLVLEVMFPVDSSSYGVVSSHESLCRADKHRAWHKRSWFIPDLIPIRLGDGLICMWFRKQWLVCNCVMCACVWDKLFATMSSLHSFFHSGF